MKFQCLFCQEIIAVDNDDCGTNVRCGSCNEVVQVPTSRVATGAVISDFLILQEIGRGGMGVVYLAHQISLARPAALKVLADQYVRNVEFITNFIKEARAAAKLNHPHIVQAYAVGEDEGVFFFAMEHIDGETLKSKLKREHRMSVEQSLAIIQQIAEALDYAWNEARIIHCDIKPDNIMLTNNSRAKLADLGLARMAGDPEHVSGDEVMGTPQYISPEQLTGAPMDGRTDIYSLGATFYHMITGHFPFEGKNATDIARKHLQEQLASPRKHAPDIPSAVCSIIHKMMAKDPNERYQDASALVEDLRLVRMGKPPTTAGSHHTSSSSIISSGGKQGGVIPISTKMGVAGTRGTTTGVAMMRMSTNTQDLLLKTDSIQTMKPMNAAELKKKRAEEAKKQMLILFVIIFVLIAACVTVVIWSIYKPHKKPIREVKATAAATVKPQQDKQPEKSAALPPSADEAGKTPYEKAASELLSYNDKVQDAPDLLSKIEDFLRKFPDPSTASEKALCVKVRKLYGPLDEKGNKLEEARRKKREAFDNRITLAEENQKKQAAAQEAESKRKKEADAKARKEEDKKKQEDQKIADYDEDLKTQIGSIRATIVEQIRLKEFDTVKKKLEKAMDEEAKFKNSKEEPRIVSAMKEKAQTFVEWAGKMKVGVETAEKLWSGFVTSGNLLKGQQVELTFLEVVVDKRRSDPDDKKKGGRDGIEEKKKTILGKIDKIVNGTITLIPLMDSVKPIAVPISDVVDSGSQKSPIPLKIILLLGKYSEKNAALPKNSMFYFDMLNGLFDNAEKIVPQGEAEFWRNEISELKKAKK